MKMKYLVLFFLLLTNVATAQPAGQDPQVQQIRAEYARINNAALTAKTILWKSPAGCEQPYQEGKVTFYYERGKLVKLYSEGGEDHGEWKEEYYFKNGQLIFIYQNDAYGGAANPTEYTYQNRYYVRDNKIFYKLESREETKSDEAQLQRLLRRISAIRTSTTSAQLSKVMACDE